MVEIKKDLSIKELFAELTTLKSKLIKLSHKYNRSMIIVSAITYKDIVTKGRRSDDIMLNRTIKREEIKDEFDIVKESYDCYREETINKIREMIASESTEYCIVYFRDELHWKWNDIAKLFNYSLRQCHNLYSKEKKK